MFDNPRIRRASEWLRSHPVRAAAFVTWVTQTAGVILQLVLIPLILCTMGREKTGIWFYLLGWTAVLTLLDFGITPTVARQISYSGNNSSRVLNRRTGDFVRGRGKPAIVRVVACQLWFVRSVNYATVIVGIVLERWVIFRGNMSGDIDGRICWYLLVLQVVLFNNSRVSSALLTGLLKPAVDRIGLSVGLLSQNVFLIIMLKIRPSLVIAGTCFAVGAFLQYLVLRYFENRIFGDYRRATGFPNLAIARQLWKLCWRFGIANVASFGIFPINALLVGRFLGPAAVTSIAIPLRIANLMTEAIRAVFVPQVNFMSNYLGGNDIRALFSSFWQCLISSSVLAIIGYSLFAWLGPAFIAIWTNNCVIVAQSFMIITGLVCITAIVESVLACFVVAHGIFPFVGVAWIGALLNVSMACLFIPRYGVVGAMSATFAAQLLSTFWFALFWTVRIMVRHARQSGWLVLRNGFLDAFRRIQFKQAEVGLGGGL